MFELAGAHRKDALERSEAALRRVQIADAGRVMGRYPHQLSGGMLQRVLIAMALASEPSLLILDEPTTALDATVQAEVLELITSLRNELATSILFISHNLAVIAQMCDEVGVMYAGELVEEGPTEVLLDSPRHPYTVGLLRCIPRPGQRKDRGRLDTIRGFLPAPAARPVACLFAPRCGLAGERCRIEKPLLRPPEGTEARLSRCHFAERAETLPRTVPEELPTGPSAPFATEGAPIVSMHGVSKTFGGRGESIPALVDIDLDVARGETLGVVGESGSGKTTLARALLGLGPADRGSLIELCGEVVSARLDGRSRGQLKALQIVFQNPDAALNRRHSVRRTLERVIRRLGGLSGPSVGTRLDDLIASVRMEPRFLPLRPTQLSGGLKQRVAIARAFAGDPEVVVCDEPTSALDVSVQAAILNLLADLQLREKVSYLFISHDLAVVRYLSDHMAVLYLGRLMEVGPAESVFEGPHHPYTEALLSAVPSLDDKSLRRIRLQGEIPSPADAVERLCLPHALSSRPPLGDLSSGRAASRRGRPRSSDALPHPRRGAAPPTEIRPGHTRNWPMGRGGHVDGATGKVTLPSHTTIGEPWTTGRI